MYFSRMHVSLPLGLVIVDRNQDVTALALADGSHQWMYPVARASAFWLSDWVVLGQESNRSFAVDASNGQVRWEDVGHFGYENRITQDNMIVTRIGGYFTNATNHVFNALTGTLLWSADLQSGMYGRASADSGVDPYLTGVTDGHLYMVEGGHDMVCRDLSTGHEIWRFCHNHPFITDATVGAGVVCAGTDDGYCLAWQRTDGSLLWKTWLGFGNKLWAQPYIQDDRVYFCTQRVIVACRLADGVVIWHAVPDIDGREGPPYSQNIRPQFVANGYFCVVLRTSSGNPYSNSDGGEEENLRTFSPDGTLVWQRKASHFAVFGHYGQLVFVGYSEGSSMTMEALDVGSGEPRPFPYSVVLDLVVSSAGILINDGNEIILIDALTFQERWRYRWP